MVQPNRIYHVSFMVWFVILSDHLKMLLFKKVRRTKCQAVKDVMVPQTRMNLNTNVFVLLSYRIWQEYWGTPSTEVNVKYMQRFEHNGSFTWVKTAWFFP